MGYCCSTDRMKKYNPYLLNISVKCDTDELKIISFCPQNEEFDKKTFKIFRYFKSSEIRYIIHSHVENEKSNSLIFFIVNTGDNYFFSLDFENGKLTELNLPPDISYAPSFQKLNNYFFITIGGLNGNCSSVDLYDIYNNKWYHVGDLSSARSGAYALLNNEDNIVYICGGVSNDGDNSFEIEYFKLTYPIGKEISFDAYPCEIKIKKIKNDFLLRKVNPVVIPLYEENSYLICGGSNIFQDTVTCTFYYTDEDGICLAKNLLPKSFKNNANSQNTITYKNSIYFFISEIEVIKYSQFQATFLLIENYIQV